MLSSNWIDFSLANGRNNNNKNPHNLTSQSVLEVKWLADKSWWGSSVCYLWDCFFLFVPPAWFIRNTLSPPTPAVTLLISSCLKAYTLLTIILQQPTESTHLLNTCLQVCSEVQCSHLLSSACTPNQLSTHHIHKLDNKLLAAQLNGDGDSIFR